MLRYKMNILAELKKVGYSSYRLRSDKILGEGTLQKMRTGGTNINLESLDIICKLLNCQPGDLVEWVPDE